MQCGILVWSASQVDEDSPDTSVRSGLSQTILAWIPFRMVHVTPREIVAQQLGTLDANLVIF